MHHNCSCNEFLGTKKQRCQHALGRFWSFVRFFNIRIRLQIHVANTLILLHMLHADDTVCLTGEQAKEVDSMQDKVLRTILQLPQTTNIDAMLYLTGERISKTKKVTRRVKNLQRIKLLPSETHLKKMYVQRTWHQRSYVFSIFEKEQESVRNYIRYTTIITEEEFTKATRPRNHDLRTQSRY